MKPVSPTFPGVALPSTVFGSDQPQYQPLPAYCCEDTEHTVISRWRLSWRERLHILWRGNIWLSLMTFGHPIQPSMLNSEPPINIGVKHDYPKPQSVYLPEGVHPTREHIARIIGSAAGMKR